MSLFNYIHVTTHDFKTNLSRYLRMLERGDCRAIIVQRHATPVGMLVPMTRLEKNSRAPEGAAAAAEEDEEAEEEEDEPDPDRPDGPACGA